MWYDLMRRYSMELIDLLSGFDLNKLDDSTLQSVAKGLAIMLVSQPLYDSSAKDADACKAAISRTVDRYMRRITTGGLFDKVKMIAEVRGYMKKAPKSMKAGMLDVDVQPMVELTQDMHVHNMSDSDYQKIADEFARIAVDTGTFMECLTTRKEPFTGITEDAACKIYTVFKLALASKDELIDKAKESKEKAKKKH